MGLQAHPCSNKRTIEGLEEPSGGCRTQLHYNHQQQAAQFHGGPRAAKQQCTIRVGVEAPDHLTTTTLVPASNCASETVPVNNNWYRDVQQTPDYESYVNGFNAAEARASTPYSAASITPSYYSTSTSHNSVENVSVAAVEFSSYSNNSSSGEIYSSQNVYQSLTSMLPIANGGGETLADRFERVCSSPRPYVVQYGREEPTAVTASSGYHYGSSSNDTTNRSEERYWSFGYTSHCPKKTTATNGYAKCNSYTYNNTENGFGHMKTTTASTGYQQQQQLASVNGQTIQRDENGKSYLELGGKAAVQPDWTRPAHTWPANHVVTQPQHYTTNTTASSVVKTCCSKCGHVLLNQSRSLAQPCYRHQRLSVLSLSMLKLNRYRQCSDPSLHRSVLICNTLRHIEDEMEREGLVCNPSAEASAVSPNNCDTCCCSHCGTVFTNNSAAKPDNTPAIYNNAAAAASISTNMNNNTATVYEPTSDASFNGNTDYNAAKTSIANADEDDSGFGDEDSRDIDWSSVFSMSTTSGFDVSSNNSSNSNPSDSYLCDSNSSDPSLFAGAELVGELGPNWKNSHCGSATNGHTSWASSDASDFSGVRWKTELGDELEGFVHILVGS